MQITIFSTETCPRCHLLATKLHEWGYQAEEKLVAEATTDEIAEVRMDLGIWPPLMVPVLYVDFGGVVCVYGDRSLFPQGNSWLDEDKLQAILRQGQ